MECKARLRGLERIISAKTISPWLSRAKPACAERELQRWPSRPLAIGYRLSALWGKARLRGTRTPTV